MGSDEAVGPPLILLVGSASSVYVARWAELLRGGPFRVVIFPSVSSDGYREFETTDGFQIVRTLKGLARAKSRSIRRLHSNR